MPANTDMPDVRLKCTYGNIAAIELLCVRVATLLRNKYSSILRCDVIYKAIHQNCQDFFNSKIFACP